jgi:hypothetical protein
VHTHTAAWLAHHQPVVSDTLKNDSHCSSLTFMVRAAQAEAQAALLSLSS